MVNDMSGGSRFYGPFEDGNKAADYVHRRRGCSTAPKIYEDNHLVLDLIDAGGSEKELEFLAKFMGKYNVYLEVPEKASKKEIKEAVEYFEKWVGMFSRHQ